MKRLLLFFTVIVFVFVAACNKDKNKYKPPTDLSRYTKKIAGSWNWHGWYSTGSSVADTGGTFDIIYIDDVTIKFRETVYYYERINTEDSEWRISYVNPLLKNVYGDAEIITYKYLGDSIIYGRFVDMHSIMGLTGHRK